ncbi:hypothetical protein CesoFtcFv8_027739 [Champsocephalus esox]|uniref:Uncharacterized protein n=2 Tax=Champsocephalus esox TaxID=159716 RepID=A0AAN8AYE8_9TELE|nr:hypothetical protein CesoFtcFv8_027739 [Champsocephalus esox]
MLSACIRGDMSLKSRASAGRIRGLWHLQTDVMQRLQSMEQKNTELFFCLSDQQGGTETPGRAPKETHTHTLGVHGDEQLMCNEEERHICTEGGEGETGRKRPFQDGVELINARWKRRNLKV